MHVYVEARSQPLAVFLKSYLSCFFSFEAESLSVKELGKVDWTRWPESARDSPCPFPQHLHYKHIQHTSLAGLFTWIPGTVGTSPTELFSSLLSLCCC